jgi:zinc protease
MITARPSAPRAPHHAAHLLALALSLAAAVPALAKEKPVGKPVEHQGYFATYPTGLRLAVYELPNAPRVSLGVSWLAGSMDDPKGKEGLAHLVEHLAFRRRVTGGTVWQRLQGDGVAFNAFTTHDATVYFETGKPDQLRSLLTLELQRVKDPLLGVTAAEFETEREVVVSELRERRQAAPERDAHEALEARLFGAGHPYGRSVGGTEESVRRITWPDVQGFVERLYRPERAILTIIGPRSAKEVGALAFDQLGPLATGPEDVMTIAVPPAQRAKVAVPPDPPHELLTLRGAVARPVLLVAFAVPGEAAEGRAMASASASYLSNVLGSALWGRSDYEKVAEIGARYSGHDGAGMIVVRVELEQGFDPGRALGLLRDNLFKAGNQDTAQRAMVAERIRDSQLVSTYLALENLNVGDVAGYLRATGKQDAIRGRQLQALSLNQSIEDYWHEFLRRSRSAAVLVLPDPERPAPLAGGSGLSARMTDTHSEEGGSFTPRRAIEEVAHPPGLDQAVRTRLPNGLTVVLVRRPLLPLAEARLVIPTDLAGQGGISTLMPRFAMDFAGTSADARWMHSGRLGAQGYTTPGLESVAFMRRGSAATLPELLEDLERLTHNFEFSRSRATTNRDWMAKSLAASRRLPSGIANEAFDDALYPEHPYGHHDLPADAEALKTDAAEAWVDQQLVPDLATLIVAGDIEPGGELLKKITAIFGGWKPGRAGPLRRAEPPLPREPRLLLVDQPGSRLAELRVGLRAPPATMRDGAAGDAVARRLGQTLQETLRVGAGTTYGVHARFTELPLASTLFLETAVDASVAGEALVRLLAGVEGLAQVPLPEEAAVQVRWLLARDFSMEFDTTSQVAGALATSAARGLPPDHWERQAASIVSLTPGRIQALARSLLGHEVILVMGDARVVGPQLKEAGFDAELVTSKP